MGKKGARLTQDTTRAAEGWAAQLESLGEVTHRKMFGGYGLFEGGKMFALVTSEGTLHLKSGPGNLAMFEQAGGRPFGKMPYYSVPGPILEDRRKFLRWATSARDEAHGAASRSSSR